jgi:hypothetical protein
LSGSTRAVGRPSISGWRPSRGQVQVVALLAAALLAYNGARILNDSPQHTAPVLDNFDTSLPWLGAALLALVVAALTLGPPRWRWGREAVAAFWRAHWLEALVFAGILVFGVFMRAYRFQTTLPPSGGLCCEEAINGGVAYRALQGERPLNFLITRWGSAAGFAVFGENTLGLRFFFIVMSIVTLIAFYFLLRELVSRQVALFGMALFAAAWWPSLRARQASEGTIYAVLFALVLVRGLKTKRPLMFLCTGILAGLMSYEYEPFKAVPIIGALFLGAAAAREVLLRPPVSPRAAWARARTLFSAAWRPLVIALMATGVVLVPMIIGTHRGYDLYLTSLHRQESGRSGDRVSTAWRTQLKWEAEIFLPVGPNDYPAVAPREVPGKELLDPLTAWLGIAGLFAGTVLVFRSQRGLFITWVAVSLGAGALLLSDFGPWKFLTLVPVFIALAAFLLDDARRLIVARFADRGALVFGTLLVAGAAFSFWWNADTLFRQVAPSYVIAESYGGERSMLYAVCHDLQDRPEGNYTIAASGDLGLAGFAQPRDSYDAQLRAWGDYIWVCHDLQGTAVPAAEELWPLRDVPAGPLSIVIGDPLSKMDSLAAQLRFALPNLHEPDRHVVGPGNSYEFAEYHLASVDDLGAQGLLAEYSGGVEAFRASRIDAVNDLSWDQAGLPVATPATVHWQGLVYLTSAGRVQLQARDSNGDPVGVLVDGQTVFDTANNASQYIDLVAGWHTVDITLNKREAGGSMQLAWVTETGAEQSLQAQDLFPIQIQLLGGWVHLRSTGLPSGLEQATTQRIDFAPHLVSTAVVRALARTTSSEPLLTEERWRGVWHIDRDGQYTLRADFPAGAVTILVDGVQAASEQAPLQGAGQVQAALSLSAGPHTVEIVQKLDRDVPIAGLTLSALANGQPLKMSVTPY